MLPLSMSTADGELLMCTKLYDNITNYNCQFDVVADHVGRPSESYPSPPLFRIRAIYMSKTMYINWASSTAAVVLIVRGIDEPQTKSPEQVRAPAPAR
ncbi:hypothetical protein EVAR_4983_1 [Eumeta japonica]|uniref:Uncharacterized protein n=1 Tax=Eumeta variegata TaxID=151549 RepID=A0A4C1UZ59_EUMVA|nr:hypothetical protein EVAR_4983_1 [Eumeta japonica]